MKVSEATILGSEQQNELFTNIPGSVSKVSANQTGMVLGNPTVPNGAVYMLNSNGQRNRQFQVAGLEPRLTSQLGTVSHELEVGARVLVERANEQFIIGKKPMLVRATSATTKSGRAWA